MIRNWVLVCFLVIVSISAFSQGTISGSVILDTNQDGVLDQNDWKLGVVRVYLYEDTNGNGIIDPGEPQIAVSLTNGMGEYMFDNLPPGDYIVTFEQEDLPQDKIMLTDENFPVTIGSGESVTGLDLAYQGESPVCWGVGDDGDELWMMNRFSGQSLFIGDLGTGSTEAAASRHGETFLYAIDGDEFGVVDLITGRFTAIGRVGEGQGMYQGQMVNIGFEDVDGLTFDPVTGDLWGSVRLDEGGDGPDVLIKIDPATGKFILNAFGPGQDFLVINVPLQGGIPVPDVDDIAIDPITGELYAIANDGGNNDFLIKIDKTTGAVTVVGKLTDWDMEGLCFTKNGQLYGVTGERSNSSESNNTLYLIDKYTGQLQRRAQFEGGGDYEAVECHDLSEETNEENCQATVTATGGAYCEAGSINLRANGTLSGGGEPVYKWSPATGLSDTSIANPVASPAQTTTYTVTVADPDDQACAATATVVVEVYEKPTVTIDKTDTECGRCIGTAVVTAQGEEPFTYSWNNNETSNQLTGLCVGTYSVTVTDNNGCEADTNVRINTTDGPDADFEFETECNQFDVSFVSTSNDKVEEWRWFYQNSEVGTGPEFNYTFPGAGIYNITLVVSGSDSACPDTISKPVVLNEGPHALFSYSVQCGNTEVTFKDSSYAGSTGIMSWNWDMGNGVTSTEQNPAVTYSGSGSFTVTLIVIDSLGCSDTLTKSVDVQPTCEFELWFPNAFTPDRVGQGPSPNNRARVRGKGIAELEVHIFDRWGELVYHTTDIDEAMNNGWDGIFEGEPVDVDSYAYYITAKPECCLREEEEVFIKGSLTLLR